ncbi:hypothetical protein A2911_00770 [Candidatus Nomurabacteria bacterium RIFCSPLOWO2_01_FULL_40_15]|uniref:Major facilitator superfamily (MFS) profile domain-containing protein n=1 Tax=Candidatus Nomurabacteria bacterium RIFCSPLOWO2_01_FULL_40_15 TaxID=1801772 RepID=A0A1F6X748_9BACT|nr:MAG: hypothetical protein A2911_00770 [Candidatus Nomurabacteria bacterium RIFCSPLOWO2_01_FULL_40_15]
MQHNRKIIYLAGFLFSMPIALTSYVNSSFLENYISQYYVGILYIIASAITIVSMLEMHRILTRLGNRFTVVFFSVLTFFSFLLLSFSTKGIVVISAFVLYFISTNFIIASLDIFVEDFSKKSSIGTFRGLYLMVVSSAWVVAQMISGTVITKSSYGGIYFLASGFMILVCVIFIFFLKDFKDPEYKRMPVLKTIETFAQNKKLSKIYIINLILKFFFAWMIIYTPIYLHQYVGFDWKQIGLIFTIMLLPFIILDFPLGKLSDRVGEKKMLALGFVISASATLLIPFISSATVWLWALILFTTRVGAATIEVMSESYFFKSVQEEDVGTTSFFRNTTPLSFILAPLIATPILFLVPSFEYLFFVLGIILLLGLFITIRLKDVR